MPKRQSEQNRAKWTIVDSPRNFGNFLARKRVITLLNWRKLWNSWRSIVGIKLKIDYFWNTEDMLAHRLLITL